MNSDVLNTGFIKTKQNDTLESTNVCTLDNYSIARNRIDTTSGDMQKFLVISHGTIPTLIVGTKPFRNSPTHFHQFLVPSPEDR